MGYANTKYNTEKRKANVGERILITNAGIHYDDYKNGDVLTVGGYYEDSARHAVKSTVPGMISINHDEYEVIIADKPSKSERISLLESQVAELQVEVEALEKRRKPATVLVHSPNEQRKAVIERAKALVTKNQPLRGRKVEYVVNVEKRTVVALVYNVSFGFTTGIYARGIAKCAPDDVFNADIGKAIALGRALGLDVSEFENAVKPTELVVGHVITEVNGSSGLGRIYKVENGKAYNDGLGSWWRTDLSYNTTLIGLDDTEAQY